MFVNDIRNSFTEFLCTPSHKALFLSLGWYSDTSAKVQDERVFFLLGAAAAAALVATPITQHFNTNY